MNQRVYSRMRAEDDEKQTIQGFATRGITRIILDKHSAFVFGVFLGDMVRKHIGLQILSRNKVGPEARNKLWDEITVKSAKAKMAVPSVFLHTMGRDSKKKKKKEIEQDEEPPRGTLWLKGRVNIDGEYQDDEIRSVGDKLKETEDKIKEGTLQVDQGTDAMTLVLGKEKEGYARGVECTDPIDSSTNDLVSLVEIHLINSSADEEGETTIVGCDQNDASIQKKMQKRETVKSVGAKRTTRSIKSRFTFQRKCVSTTTTILWHLKKTTIIAEGTVYKSDGKIMLHNKALPKDCYKVSIDKSRVDAAFIPDVGSNGCTTATPPSTIQMITVENKVAPKVPTKCKNFYVSSDAMQKEANKKRSQKALVY
ncbi:hypothetical protein Tco_0936849 [Tanacetum coccineum]|uniref:Uncharacterized protein n=1 Tax=Tanacetum coccineum TaxID=301880 RepID=A0ABQ5DJK9_9ASTR